MSEMRQVRVPDIGDIDEVEVVEVLVAVGDRVEAEQGLITLESDKASMEIPSPTAGVVRQLAVQPGDQVAEGALILTLEGEAAAAQPEDAKATAAPTPAAPTPESPAVAPVEAPAPAAAAAPSPASAGTPGRVVVLGSGPGGYTAAFRAADLGLDVTLVERYPVLGGVCLNVGCIPSKALLHAAKVIDEAQAFADHGIRFAKPKIDLDGLRDWKSGVVGRLTGGLATMARQRKVRVVHGSGTFTGPHTLRVETAEGPEDLAFDQAIIAAGSRSTQIPGFPDDDPRVMDSTGALELADTPRRLLVVGGGIIGLEMATVYHALGSRVTVVELLDRLIPGCDRDIVRPLHRWIEKRYEAIHLETKVTAIKPLKKGLKVTLESSEGAVQETYDRVLVAVGRQPNGGRIGAEAAGVAVDERGFIPVDRQQRTNVPHIFAIGDIVGQPMLAHKAVHEGKVAAEVIAGERSSFDARVIPSVAYTDPEVAWAGLQEEEAKEQGVSYEKAIFPWSASGRSLSLGRSEGKTKMLFDPDSGRLLGAGIVGPAAGDLISEVALAIEMDADAADIGLTIHPHPTLSETIAFSAEAFEGTLTDLYLPKQRRGR